MSNPHLPDLRAEVSTQYVLDYIPRESDTLLIVMAPTPRLVLMKYPFAQSTLHLADRFLSFYTNAPYRNVNAIVTFARARGYRRLLFVGSSKGGSGALLWSSIAQEVQRDMAVQCIAFSPQTMLFPHNPVLDELPSYRISLDRLEGKGRAHLAKDFRRFGNIQDFIRGRTALTTVYYSSGYGMDVAEADRLRRVPGLRLIPVDLPFHGSIMPFTLKSGDEAAIERLADKLYADAAKDQDLARSLPDRREDFVSSMRKLSAASLNDVIAETLARGTEGRRTRLRLLNGLFRLYRRQGWV